MPTFQYHFLTKFYPGLSLVSSKIGKFKVFTNLSDKLFIFVQIKLLSEIVFTGLPSLKIFHVG